MGRGSPRVHDEGRQQGRYGLRGRPGFPLLFLGGCGGDVWCDVWTSEAKQKEKEEDFLESLERRLGQSIGVECFSVRCPGPRSDFL